MLPLTLFALLATASADIYLVHFANSAQDVEMVTVFNAGCLRVSEDSYAKYNCNSKIGSLSVSFYQVLNVAVLLCPVVSCLVVSCRQLSAHFISFHLICFIAHTITFLGQQLSPGRRHGGESGVSAGIYE